MVTTLVLMHVPGADRANELFSLATPQGERDLVEAHAVIGALAPVPGIPIKGGYALQHR
jgi:hypothetical protein